MCAQVRLTPYEAQRAMRLSRLAVGKFELLLYLKSLTKKFRTKTRFFFEHEKSLFFFTIYQNSLKTAGHVIDSLHLSGQFFFL